MNPSDKNEPPSGQSASPDAGNLDNLKQRLKASVEVVGKLPPDAVRIAEALNRHSVMSITDADGVIIFVSDEFCALSGYPRDELLGRNHSVIGSDSHSVEFFQRLWRTISSSEHWQGLLCNRKKNGNLYWVHTTITPVRDHRGEPEYYIAIHTDVTRLKYSEQVHEKRSKLLELLHSHTNALLNATLNEQRQGIRRVVDEWREVMNVDLGILISAGKPDEPLQIHHQSPDLNEGLRQALESLCDEQVVKALRSNECPRIDLLHNPDDMGAMQRVFADHGFELLLELPIGDSERRHDSMVFLWENDDALASIREQLSLFHLLCDIIATAQQRLQTETWLKTQTEVQDARQYLAQLGDWDMDVASLEVAWTPELFGLEEGKSRLSLTEFIEIVHPEDRSRFFSELNRCINQHVPASFEFRIGNADAEPTWVLIRGARMRNRARRTDRLIATLIDVTQQKQTEIALKRATAQAELANRTKSKFLSSMSHELRTPLNSILGFGQLLELNEDLDADQKDSVAEIIRSGEHLLSLINEVLDLSLIESGRPNIILERVNASRVIEESLAMIRQLARQQNIRVEVGDLAPATIFVDRIRLKQCVINILSNAVKYNRPGGSVSVRTMTAEDHKLVICIEDTGVGIDIDRQKDLFTPFERLGQEQTGTEGTGIGLALTKVVVDLMGGEISFVSTLGEGTTFFLSFSMPAGESRSPLSDVPEHRVELGSPVGTIDDDHIVVIGRGSRAAKLVESALGDRFPGRLSAFEPNYPLEKLGERIETQILVVDANPADDEAITPQLLAELEITFGDPWMIALLDAQELPAFGDLAPYFDYICLLPIDATKLRRTLQRVKTRIALTQAGQEPA